MATEDLSFALPDPLAPPETLEEAGEAPLAPEETDGAPLASFFDAEPESEAASNAPPDPFAQDDQSLADAAVDDLLAGIWTTGTPETRSLGVNPDLIEEAEFDVVGETPEPAGVPYDAADPDLSTPDPEPARGMGRPFEPVGIPKGLPTMPVGWTPTMSAPDEEYEPDPYDRPESRMPWVPLGIGAVVLALIVAGVFLWPRFQAQQDGFDAPAAAVADAPTSTPEASGDLAAEEVVPDSALTDAEAAAIAAEAEQFLIGPADAAGETTVASGGAASSRSRSAGGRERGELSRPSPEALAAAAADLDPRSRTARETRATTPQTSASGGVPAPEVSGLEPELAAALAGSAPIRTDATGFTWVVSSTGSRADAGSVVERYRQAGFRARVIEGVVDGRPMYRIAIGQFDTREMAYRVRDLLPADIRGRNDIWTLNLADV